MPQQRVLQGDIQSTVTTLHSQHWGLFFCLSFRQKSTTVGSSNCIKQHFSSFPQHINNTAAHFSHSFSFCFTQSTLCSVSVSFSFSSFMFLTSSVLFLSSSLSLSVSPTGLFLSHSPVGFVAATRY